MNIPVKIWRANRRTSTQQYLTSLFLYHHYRENIHLAQDAYISNTVDLDHIVPPVSTSWHGPEAFPILLPLTYWNRSVKPDNIDSSVAPLFAELFIEIHLTNNIMINSVVTDACNGIRLYIYDVDNVRLLTVRESLRLINDDTIFDMIIRSMEMAYDPT